MKSIFFLLFILMSCSASQSTEQKCQYHETQLKLIIPSITDTYNSMELYLYADKLLEKCNDSLELMKVVKRYLEQTPFEQRVTELFIYSDSTKFDHGEPLCQNWTEVNRSCIVGVHFNEQMVVDDFYFYDDSGKLCSKGPLWRPCR